MPSSGRAKKRVEKILKSGKWQHTFIRPKVFTFSLFPIWYVASFTGGKPEERLWEDVRSLDPLPEQYDGRFTNVQAAIGLAGLQAPARVHRAHAPARAHARRDARRRARVSPSRRFPPDARTCITSTAPTCPTARTIVKRCIRRGVDVAPMHVDVCTKMELFGWTGAVMPGAEKAATAVQVPVYESLSDPEIERVGRLVAEQVRKLSA